MSNEKGWFSKLLGRGNEAPPSNPLLQQAKRFSEEEQEYLVGLDVTSAVAAKLVNDSAQFLPYAAEEDGTTALYRLIQTGARSTHPSKQMSAVQPVFDPENKAPREYVAGEVLLSRYEIVQALEDGFWGKRYLAKHLRWDEPLVLQPISTAAFSKEQQAQLEADITAWVKLGIHPNLASCHYLRTIEDIPCLVSEYVAGSTLQELIEDPTTYAESPEKVTDRLFDLAFQICFALRALHELRIQHLALSPRCARVTPEGRLQLEGPVGESLRRLLQQNKQQREAPSAYADLYLLGWLLCELFIGEMIPQAPTSWVEFINTAKNTLKDKGRALPSGLGKLLQQCLAPTDPTRTPSLRTVIDALREIYQKHFRRQSPRPEPTVQAFLPDSLNNRALALLDIGRSEDAEILLEDALKAAVGHIQSDYNLALLKWRRGEINTSLMLQTLESITRREPIGAEGFLLKAWTHVENGDREAATRYFQEASGLTVEKAAQENIQREASYVQGNYARLQVMRGHVDWVSSVLISPDGKTAISGGTDAKICVWNLATAECRMVLRGHEHWVDCLAISANGRYLLSGSQDNTLRLWDLQDGSCQAVLTGHRKEVWSVFMTPDARYAFSGSDDGTIRFWDLQAKQCLRVLEGHQQGVEKVAATVDIKRVVSASADGTLRIWNAFYGKCIATLTGHEGKIKGLSLSTDGKMAVSCGVDGKVRVWNLTNQLCTHVLDKHIGIVMAVALSGDNSLVLSGGEDKVLRLWNTKTGSCLHELKGHIDRISSVLMTPNGHYALSGSYDNTLRVWDLRSGRCLNLLLGHSSTVYSIAMTLNGRIAVSASNDNTVRSWKLPSFFGRAPVWRANLTRGEALLGEQWDFEKGLREARRALDDKDGAHALVHLQKSRESKFYESSIKPLSLWSRASRLLHREALYRSFCVQRVVGHQGRISDICIASAGKLAVTASEDKTLRVWDLVSGKALHTLSGHEGSVLRVLLIEDGAKAVSSSEDGTLRIWDVITGSCVQVLSGHEGLITSIACSDDGRVLVSGGEDGSVRVWETLSGKCLHILTGHYGPITSVAISAQGDIAVSGGVDQQLFAWDTNTGSRLYRRESNQKTIEHVALSKDGSHLLSIESDSSCYLWNGLTGELRGLLASQGQTRCVAVRPDGVTALTGEQDGTVRLWDLETQKNVLTQQGHRRFVHTVAFGVDSRFGLSAGEDKNIYIWDLIQGGKLGQIKESEGRIESIALSRDARLLLIGTHTGNLCFWHLDWELESRESVDWYEPLLPMLRGFLASQRKRAGKRLDAPVWNAATEKLLLRELQHAGYSWVRPEGIHAKLLSLAETMTQQNGSSEVTPKT